MTPNIESHEFFDRLCALVAANEASPEEERNLMSHLADCPSCQQAFEQYNSILVHTKIDIALNEESASKHAVHTFEHARAKNRVLEACRRFLGTAVAPSRDGRASFPKFFWEQKYFLAGCAAAACMLIFLSLQFLNRTRMIRPLHESEVRIANLQKEVRQLQDQLAKSAADRQAAGEMASSNERAVKSLADQNTQLQFQLSGADSARQQEASDLDALRDQARLLQASLDVLKTSNRALGSDNVALFQKIDGLTASLQESRHQLEGMKSQNEELARVAQEEGKQAEHQQRLLATDTDIRDILGARSLHIIDVYDVADNGQMERPFGRIFFSEGKSLIFYGFDFDRQKGLKANVVFRAWGEKAQANTTPYNLGTFYVDDKTQNRWVLKCDDNKILSKIDYVFVTDSSAKARDVFVPQKKPLLYASLR